MSRAAVPLLESTVRQLDRLAAETQRDRRLPTLADAVFRDGHLLWSRAIGFRSYEPDGTPGVATATGDSHRIGSITKSFTAVLILQLRDEGRLDLTDSLGDHLPAATGALREAFARVRLLDLASHRGGLAREPEAGFWWERNVGQQVADLVADRGAADVRTPGGAGHHYSNLGFGLLGAVVEQHRAQPWRDALAARILDPLGLADTGCEPQTPAPQGYSVHPWCDDLMPEPTPDTGAMAPAGQLWSTLADLGRWGSFLADPAGIDPDGRVLAPGSVALLRTSRGPALEGEPEGPPDESYGLALSVYPRAGRLLNGHGGSMPGHLAGLVLHPASRAAAVTFASSYNTYPPTSHAADLLTAVLDAEPTEAAPWAPVLPTSAVRELLGSGSGGMSSRRSPRWARRPASWSSAPAARNHASPPSTTPRGGASAASTPASS